MSYKSKIHINTSSDFIEVNSQNCGDCAIACSIQCAVGCGKTCGATCDSICSDSCVVKCSATIGVESKSML